MTSTTGNAMPKVAASDLETAVLAKMPRPLHAGTHGWFGWRSSSNCVPHPRIRGLADLCRASNAHSQWDVCSHAARTRQAEAIKTLARMVILDIDAMTFELHSGCYEEAGTLDP
jgi:hypothetical protein